MSGANATYYAPNASVCINNALNLYQYDVDLLVIKIAFGNFKNNVLNSTLLARNVSDSIVLCVDAAENLYVWSQYKYETFGSNLNNFVLSGI